MAASYTVVDGDAQQALRSLPLRHCVVFAPEEYRLRAPPTCVVTHALVAKREELHGRAHVVIVDAHRATMDVAKNARGCWARRVLTKYRAQLLYVVGNSRALAVRNSLFEHASARARAAPAWRGRPALFPNRPRGA